MVLAPTGDRNDVVDLRFSALSAVRTRVHSQDRFVRERVGVERLQCTLAGAVGRLVLRLPTFVDLPLVSPSGLWVGFPSGLLVREAVGPCALVVIAASLLLGAKAR